MKTEDIIKSNKLIVDFIGYEANPFCDEEDIDDIRYLVDDHLGCIADGVNYYETTEEDWSSWFNLDEMKFHSDWNWLMPVAKMCCVGEAENSYNYEDFYDALCDFNILKLYKEIVKFIKWYNKKRSN